MWSILLNETKCKELDKMVKEEKQRELIHEYESEVNKYEEM